MNQHQRDSISTSWSNILNQIKARISQMSGNHMSVNEKGTSQEVMCHVVLCYEIRNVTVKGVEGEHTKIALKWCNVLYASTAHLRILL